MRNVRSIAMIVALFVVSACSNNDFHNAYSASSLGGVQPIGLDD